MGTEDTKENLAENARRLDPAFPLLVPGEFYAHGLSKRELFAAMAMQGLLAADMGLRAIENARLAIQNTDALIAALKGE